MSHTLQSKPLLQSAAWLDFQRSLGRAVSDEGLDGIQASAIEYETWLGKKYLYIPQGPALDTSAMPKGIKNTLRQFAEKLRAKAKQRHDLFVLVEPVDDSVAELLCQHGFRKSTKEIQPHKTVIIDITKSPEDLQAAMHYKTRYNIKVAERHGIEVAQSDDIDIFWNLLKETAKRDRFAVHPKSYFEKMFAFFKDHPDLKISLFVASSGKHAVAAALVAEYAGVGYYLHGASHHEFRSFMAPYKLHWQVIQYLKQRGIGSYDLWGIDAKRYPGVTRFKLGWGGQVREYPGAFELRIAGFWYYAFRLARWLRSLI